jgi:hypothetical protein
MNDPYPERSYEVSDQAGTNIETEAVAKQIDQKAWDWAVAGGAVTALGGIVSCLWPPSAFFMTCVGLGVVGANYVDSLSERTKASGELGSGLVSCITVNRIA